MFFPQSIPRLIFSFFIIVFQSDLAVCGDQLFTCISNQAVWRRPLAETGGMHHHATRYAASKIAEFSVDPPSAADRAPVVSFTLPAPERVTVTLYHMSGRVASTFVDGILQPGRHVLKLPADRLAPGCYIMQLQAGADCQMKRIPVIR
jgi:hypothetical protein